MGLPFNPYRDWLGIDLDDRFKPHHYELLGLELFENDVQCIEAAADQAKRLLRKLDVQGRELQRSQLLDEVQSATTCLLNDGKRHVYDHLLRYELFDKPAGKEFTPVHEPSATVQVIPVATLVSRSVTKVHSASVARGEQSVHAKFNLPSLRFLKSEVDLTELASWAEQYRVKACELRAEGKYDQAQAILSELASAPEPALRKYVAWARREQEWTSTSANAVQQDMPEAIACARRHFRNHDYANAALALFKVPEQLRSSAANALLAKATALESEVATLVAEIDHAVRNKARAIAVEKLEQLLNLQPGRTRARWLLFRLNAQLKFMAFIDFFLRPIDVKFRSVALFTAVNAILAATVLMVMYAGKFGPFAGQASNASRATSPDSSTAESSASPTTASKSSDVGRFSPEKIISRPAFQNRSQSSTADPRMFELPKRLSFLSNRSIDPREAYEPDKLPGKPDSMLRDRESSSSKASSSKVAESNASMLQEKALFSNVPLRLGTNGMSDSKSTQNYLEPKLVKQTWAEQGTFAHLRGKGEMTYPKLNKTSYVVIADIEMIADLSDVDFFFGSGSDLSHLNLRLENDNHRFRVFNELRDQCWYWNGFQGPKQDKVHFHIVVNEGKILVIANGVAILGGLSPPSEFALRIVSNTPESDVIIRNCVVRPIANSDTTGIDWEAWQPPSI